MELMCDHRKERKPAGTEYPTTGDFREFFAYDATTVAACACTAPSIRKLKLALSLAGRDIGGQSRGR